MMAMKIRVTSEMRMPRSRTRPAFSAYFASSSSRRPKSLSSRAPPTLKRSVIMLPRSALPSICCRVRPLIWRPTHREASSSSGNSARQASVTFQLRANMVMPTTTTLIELDTVLDSVEVNARWAPITSLFRRETSAPVWVRVKKARDIRCTCPKTLVRRSKIRLSPMREDRNPDPTPRIASRTETRPMASASLVLWLALAMGLVSVLDAILGVGSGFLSSRIGESLIFDLRTKVFGHVQRMSLAFFTRTQTGALVSRLNNDVIGAQRAFTSTLSSTVSNSISVVVVGITMFALSWKVTLACLALFPLLLLASRWVGRQISGLTRQQMDGNADLGNMMTERFNVGGALLLKLFGRRDEEDAKYAEKAGLVRDLGIRISLVTRIFIAIMMLIPALATALVYGCLLYTSDA